MIRLVASFEIKDEHVDQAIELAKELVGETRKERGCAQYDLVQSLELPSQIVVLEGWETKEDLDVHSASDHFARLVPQLVEMCEQPPVISSYIQLV